jgi:PE family protein
MSLLTTQPELLSAAAGQLTDVGSELKAQNAAAAVATTAVAPAAGDEVSALTAAQFISQSHIYQAISAQAAAIHDMFVATLGASAGSYATTEAANVITAS